MKQVAQVAAAGSMPLIASGHGNLDTFESLVAAAVTAASDPATAGAAPTVSPAQGPATTFAGDGALLSPADRARPGCRGSVAGSGRRRGWLLAGSRGSVRGAGPGLVQRGWCRGTVWGGGVHGALAAVGL